MPDDVVFKLTTVYDGTSVAEGMSGTTSVIEGDTAAWKEAFNSTFVQMESSNAELIASIQSLTAALDTIPVVAGRAAVETGGAFDLMTERIVHAAEVSKLEAAGIGGAFSGLGALIGGGLAVGFLTHFLDETNKEVIALGNLSSRTGVAISSLAGLQLVARELGIDFSAVEQGMARLERSQSLAVEGSKSQAEAFQRIGLTVKDIKNLAPEELFNTVSGAIQNTKSTADAAASSFTLLGRGGGALLPIFREYGGTLEETSKRLGEESKVTEEAYQQALRYQKAMADLGDALRALAISAIPPTLDAFKGLKDLWIDFEYFVKESGVTIKEWALDAASAASVLAAATQGPAAIVTEASKFAEELRDNAREAASAIAYLKDQKSEALGEKAGGGSETFEQNAPWNRRGQEPPSGAGAPPPNRMEEWKLQLQQMEDASNASHIIMESEELAFWDNILSTVKLKTSEEVEIRHNIATLNKDITKELEADVVRSYEEGARAAGEGSEKQLEILRTLYEYTVQVYGQLSPQAMHAYDEIIAASHKAAERQIKDVTEVAKAAEKAAQQRIEEAQKQLETQHKEDTTQIESSGKQAVGALGGGKGIIGGGIQLEVAQQDTQQLLALDESFAAASIANARSIEAAKVEELNKIRSETQAQYDAGALGEQAYNEKIKQLDTEQEAAVEAEQTKELDITRKTADQRFQIEQQYAKQVEAVQQEIANRMASELDKMILQSRNFHEAITKLWVDIVQGIIKQIDKMATEFITRQLIMVAAKRSADAALDAAQGTADVGKTVVNNAANAAAAESYIGVAAAAAFAGQLEISDGLDVPGAIAAAAAVDSAGQPFVAQASAADGWELPSSGGPFPMLGHPDEMMLPAPISTGLKRIITMQSLQENNSSTTNAAPAIGNLHYHAGDVHAMDGTGVSDVLSKHPAQLAKMVSGLVSRGHLDPRGFVR
jgi:hypothetical protein